jgi:hypothetical protein
MPEEKFDKQMEEWALHETNLAPKLQPTNEMVELVKQKGKRGGFRTFWPRTPQIGVILTAASLILITYLSLFKPDFLTKPVPEQLAFVSQREVMMPKAPIIQLDPLPIEKGGTRSLKTHQLAEFQIHRRDSHRIVSIDLRQDVFEPIPLSSQDSFRLLIKANQPRYLYIFQYNPPQNIQPLHPKIELQPFPPNQKVFLPVKPDWFHISGEPGEYHLLIISTSTRIIELEDLYNEYIEALDPSTSPTPVPEARQTAASGLYSYILSIKASAHPDVELWQLEFFLEN